MTVTPTRVTGGSIFGLSANAATSYTPTYPTSAAGDLLIMQVHISRTAAGAFTLPAANLTASATWNLIRTQDDTTSNGVLIAYFWAFRGSETSVTITPSVTSSIRNIVTLIRAYQGSTVHQTSPIGASGSTYSVSSGGAIVSPSVTTTLANSEIELMASWVVNTNTPTLGCTWTAPATEVADSNGFNSTITFTWNMTDAYVDQASAGASGTYTATPSTSTFQRINTAIVVQPIQPIAAADTGSGADSASVSATVPVSQTATATDAASVAPVVADTAAGAEAANVAAQVAETAAAADSAKVIVQVAETGTATDTAVGTSGTPAPDTGTGVDAATITARAADTAVAADSAAVAATTPSSDTGASSESATVAIGKPTSDTGTGSDTAVVRVGVPVADTAGTLESARITIGSADTGSATDSATVRHAGAAVPPRLHLVKVLPRLPVWTGPGW